MANFVVMHTRRVSVDNRECGQVIVQRVAVQRLDNLAVESGLDFPLDSKTETHGLDPGGFN
jgi:hypothetical protein